MVCCRHFALLWHIILILSQPSLFSYSFVLHAKWRNNKYQFYHLWLDQTGHQTHNQPHSNYCMWLIIPPLVERRLYCNHHVRPSVRFSLRSHFRNRYLSFYWKKWFYIWYMALAWWLVPCLPFPVLPHIYFLFTVWLTNEWVGVFLARRSVQHLVWILFPRSFKFQLR